MDEFDCVLKMKKILDYVVKWWSPLQAWPALTAYHPPPVLEIYAALWAKSRSRQGKQNGYARVMMMVAWQRL